MNFKSLLDDHRAKTKEAKFISIVLAFLLAILAFLQLFNLEGFILIVKNYGIFGYDWLASVVAIKIIALETLAMPFLLDMKFKDSWRFCSMLIGWVVMIFWLFMAFYLNIVYKSFEIGLLGTKIPLVGGWWLVFFLLSMGLLIAWASWASWPLKNNRKVEK